ncbi:hypothetical protein D3C76_1167870 [compost metagenome]
MHLALFGLALTCKELEQGFAQQGVKAVPGLAVGAVGAVDGDDEQVVVVEALEQQRGFIGGLRPADQNGA